MMTATSAAPVAAIDASKHTMPANGGASTPYGALAFAQTFHSAVASQGVAPDPNSSVLDVTASSHDSVRSACVDASDEAHAEASDTQSGPSTVLQNEDVAITQQIVSASAPLATKADCTVPTHSPVTGKSQNEKEQTERKSAHHSDSAADVTPCEGAASTASLSGPVQQSTAQLLPPSIVAASATVPVQTEVKTATSAKTIPAGESKPTKDRASASVDAAASVSQATMQPTQTIAVTQQVNALSAPSAKTVETSGVPIAASASRADLNIAPVAGKQEARMHTSSEATAAEPALTSMDLTRSNQLEVGVRGGEFGWVKVRAEVNTDGSVNAYLRAPAAAAAELHAQAPALYSYLGSQSIQVQSVQVEVGRSSMGMSAEGSASDGDSQRNDGRTYNSTSARTGDSTTDVSMQSIPMPWMTGAAAGPDGTGSWLSVRA